MKHKVKILIIKKFVKDNNLTVCEFCKLCGFSKSTYYYIMKKARCKFYTLIKIANATNISCDVLMGLK